MFAYQILTDVSCDLNLETIQTMDLKLTPLHVQMNHEQLDYGADKPGLPAPEFYRAMRNGAVPTTSASSPQDWKSAMEPILQAGQDVLVMTFSTELSGTYQNTLIAVNELREVYPERKIYSADTRCCSGGLGMLLQNVYHLRNSGASLEEAIAYIESHKMKIAHWFTVDNLSYLRRGGRISAAAAIAGSLMGIKPVLHMDNEGRLVNVEKRRGRRAAIEALAEQFRKTAIAPETQVIVINHADCPEDARLLESLIRERSKIAGCYHCEIGPVIGAHSGPGTLAVYFITAQR